MTRVAEPDPRVCLDSEDTIAAYLSASIADDDPGFFLAAIGHVARASGRAAVVLQSGLGREKCL